MTSRHSALSSLHPSLPSRPILLPFLSFSLLLLLLSSLSVVSAGPSHFASALTFQVEPRNEVCFYEELEQGTLFTMEFEVTRGGLLDIRLRVLDPAANTAVEKMAFFNRHVAHHRTHRTHLTQLTHCPLPPSPLYRLS